MRFAYWLWLASRAVLRGLFYRWPRRPDLPSWATSGCSCGMRSWRERWEMFRYGWYPWCFQWTRAYGWCCLFAIQREDERAENEALLQMEIRLADAYYRRQQEDTR